jgi:Ethanolamine utilization protein EutJ (predicted chaperonin)
MLSRYSIGIDLGTTNTAIAFVDTASVDEVAEAIPVADFAVPQVVAPGAVEPRPTFPSAVYVAAGHELPPDSLHLPWRAETRTVLGHFAREQGARVPTRTIHSSKSWLCHGGVSRTEPILPWQGPDEEAKCSPVEVARKILTHLREAWDHRHGSDARLEDQEITLCVPASFDAEARNLTVQAAQQAGLQHLHLLEEPQAALYSWIQSRGRAWRDELRVGDLVLVVDVGGGTTDFSLIAVTESDGALELRRVAVGEHILLGGDNMDLALAFDLRAALERERGTKLDFFQTMALTHQCRVAKERLLADDALDAVPIALLGTGSGVIAGTVRTQLDRARVDVLLLEGFFPHCTLADRPARPKRAGFREAGLPYASDAAVTRHLARFLGMHQELAAELLPGRAPGAPILPTALLFHGGVFHAPALRRRVVDVVTSWCRDAGAPDPRVLPDPQLDLAVARGAAYVGLTRRGRGVRIRGGSARAYYVGFEAPAPAVPGAQPPVKLLCVVPYGMEEGTTTAIPGAPIDLCMWTGEPVEFRFFSSTTRRHDTPGTVLDLDPDAFDEHSPLETTIGTPTPGAEGEALEVDLQSHLTEIGVLHLHVVERTGREEHRLEFNVRQQSGPGPSAH